ncbi:lipopolysaccharide biosynthesis protein [Cyclobacterium roseum]|uniref:lipopolysaccharide biosynthesis protein n=1 Tax=Cyclobacterium roseum TaxID=2666137 RepID=UPI0013910CC7|nr:MATE family efflux transporter [Cyclobacterium roseum]
MKAASRVAVNTSILYGKMAITVFISLYSTRLILNALGENDYGIFNVVAGAISMLGFLNASMTAASQRFMSYAQGEGTILELKKIFNVSLILHIVISIAAVILLEIVGHILLNEVLEIPEERLLAAKTIYQFMVISTFFSIIGVPFDAIINAHENMTLFAVIGIFESIVKFLIAWFLTYQSLYDPLIGYGLLLTLLSLFLLISRIGFCWWRYEETKFSFKKYYDPKIFKNMTNFASWSLINSSSSMISTYGQGIVLNMFFGANINAAQAIANQINGQVGVFSLTLQRALNPIIAKSEGAGNRSFMKKATLTGSRFSFYLLMLISIPLIIEMEFIFKYWLIDIPEYAIIFCRLLLIKNLVSQLVIPVNSAILAVGKIKQYQIIAAIITSLNLPINYILFKNGYEPYYLYIQFIIYQIIMSNIIIYFGKITFGLSIKNFINSVVLKTVTITGIYFLISTLIYILLDEGILRLLLLLVFGTLLTLYNIWYFGIINSEKNLLKEKFYYAIKLIKLNNK